MTPERWRRVSDLFDVAVKMTPENRGAYLDAECAGNPELRRLVDELLEASGQAADFHAAPTPSSKSTE